MMNIEKISYSLVLYLALIEGLSLVILDIIPAAVFVDSSFGMLLAFPIGFIPALLVLFIYRFKEKYLPLKINGKKITNIPLLIPSIANGLFMTFLFSAQELLPIPTTTIIGEGLFGFVSVLIAAWIVVVLYNELPLKATRIRFSIDKKHVELKHIGYFAALYAGLFEFFILPLMFVFYGYGIYPFLNGFFSGLIGSTVALFITNQLLKKNPLQLVV
jgi:drug/metabolite transporter (DMT)-like permease